MISETKKRHQKAQRLFHQNYQLYLLLLPGLIATFIFAYIPMYGVQIAFKDFHTSRGIWGSPWVGLDHFRRFVSYTGFWPMLRNTLSITLYSLATFPISIIVAIQIHELRSRFLQKTVQMISYAPHFLSNVIVCGMLLLFLSRSNGVVNNAIAALGGTRVDFLSIPEAFADIYVWSGVWQGVGWGTVIYLAALTNVSPELCEAAEIDGAGRLRIILHIHIPAILPTIIILFIMRTGGLLSLGYEKILLLQNDLNIERSNVISTYVYQIGLVSGQLSYSTAINLFNNVVNVLVLMLVNSVIRRVSEVSLW